LVADPVQPAWTEAGLTISVKVSATCRRAQACRWFRRQHWRSAQRCPSIPLRPRSSLALRRETHATRASSSGGHIRFCPRVRAFLPARFTTSETAVGPLTTRARAGKVVLVNTPRRRGGAPNRTGLSSPLYISRRAPCLAFRAADTDSRGHHLCLREVVLVRGVAKT
jgi:hypothetical protein